MKPDLFHSEGFTIEQAAGVATANCLIEEVHLTTKDKEML
jgi:hypothetical protein